MTAKKISAKHAVKAVTDNAVEANEVVTTPVASAHAASVPSTAATMATTATPLTTATTAGPLASRVSQAIGYFKMGIALLALTPPPLTPADRKRMAKLRKGGDKLIPQIAQIAQTWEVKLRTQPTEAMTSGLQMAADLSPLVTLLTGFLQEVQDTGGKAAGDSWATASALYAVLKRMSHKDPTLKTQLAPVTEFFAYRHPVVTGAKAAAAPSKTSRRKAKTLAQAEKIVANAKANEAVATAEAAQAGAGATASTAQKGA